MADSKCREANVLFEFQLPDSMPVDGLDASAEAAIAKVADRPSDIAVGPALATNSGTRTIKLCFDVIADGGTAIHEQVSKVAAVVLGETDLVLSRTTIEARPAAAGSGPGDGIEEAGGESA